MRRSELWLADIHALVLAIVRARRFRNNVLVELFAGQQSCRRFGFIRCGVLCRIGVVRLVIRNRIGVGRRGRGIAMIRIIAGITGETIVGIVVPIVVDRAVRIRIGRGMPFDHRVNCVQITGNINDRVRGIAARAGGIVGFGMTVVDGGGFAVLKQIAVAVSCLIGIFIRIVIFPKRIVRGVFVTGTGSGITVGKQHLVVVHFAFGIGGTKSGIVAIVQCHADRAAHDRYRCKNGQKTFSPLLIHSLAFLLFGQCLLQRFP